MSPFEGAESGVVAVVQWIRLCVESVGAIVVACGIVVSVYRVFRVLARNGPKDFNEVRIAFASYLALALEFQLGADILSTAIAPSWDQIGKLGAVAIIRTALNYFLMRELRDERTTTHDERRVAARAAVSSPT